ncbi:Polypyrimidine tract-binding protein-like protein [Thalictrum thalictroides]|uniref:Polypyrimidine tract-binding protein-like protein n=1 Tax=Thalictrum thalictroides TaxID=46969 RepID=A0A7J6W1D2_THATH|nr:Polypyrimidine tract-binding protein-like protein [Thalictrum thalictroides]
MTSTSSQPHFRHTQPPSKVLHLRNCPWECTDEELVELGKPFGKVVNTKCNVGANRNQAFIEFEELNQAMAMISYYSSSLDPAQLRGKTIYLQYSNRQEIVHNKTSGDVTGNVLLVTIEGVGPHEVSIEVLHLVHVMESSSMAAYFIWRSSSVFSAFGVVQKIATFEKTAGFQALIQFSDQESASTARSTLDGRSIPSYLLPENVSLCMLKITFSGHTDLNVKFQSHRSRDYTNLHLPVGPLAIDNSGQFAVGVDGKNQEQESNVLLASIENMQYPVNVDILYTIFSSLGLVQKIAMFEKNAGTHALIQYPDAQTAVAAKAALEGHSIYDGGFCKLHISYSRHTDLSVKVNNDRSRDYTTPSLPMLNTQPSILGQQPILPMGHTAPLYGSPQFAPAANEMNGAQPIAQCGVATAAAPQLLTHQFPTNTYMPPGAVHYETGPPLMQMPSQFGQPPVIPMPPYHY